MCIKEDEVDLIMVELHEGIWESHVEGRVLMLRVLKVGYFWLTIRNDNMEYAKKCDQWQRYSN